jgi:pSer/pThr/pTyr-binding forkhead associated (FHA) protein
MIRLTLNFAGRAIGKYNFDQELICIGREPTCDIQIDNIGVSRRHAAIEREDGQYVLKDLQSHNGVFVKGQKVEKHRLGEVDEFFIGKYSIEFESLKVTVQEPVPDVPATLEARTGQDMTFRLDKAEIDRLLGASALANMPKLSQIAPEGEKWTVQLEGHYFLIGKHPKSTIRVEGLLAPLCGALLVRCEKHFRLLNLSRWLGLKVNGAKVFEKQLEEGDVLEFGKRKFRYSFR